MAIKKSIAKNKKQCKVTFSLPAEAAPNANCVRVVGDFNNWDWNEGVELSKGDSAFQGQLTLEAGQRHEFRYLIDNQRWENDWKADDYSPTPYGWDNSVVITTNDAASTVASAKAGKAPATAAKKITSRITKTVKRSKSKIDFTVIEGVGPKICQLLEKAGYPDFQALSQANVKDLKQVLTDAGSRYQMHDPSKWAQQAKLASKNQWSKLNEFQATLKKNK